MKSELKDNDEDQNEVENIFDTEEESQRVIHDCIVIESQQIFDDQIVSKGYQVSIDPNLR